MIFMGSSLFILPLYLQNLLGYSAAKAGWILLGMTLFVAVSSPIVGKILDKLGFSRPVFVSMLFAVLASICLFFFASPVNWVVILLGLMFLGLAIGVHTPSTIHGVSVEVDKANAGTALGLFFTLAISGATIGVALSGTLLNFVSVHYLSVHYSQSLTPDLEQAITGVRSVLTLPVDLQSIATQSFMVAFRTITSVMFVLMLVGCGLSFRLTRLNKSC